MEVKKSGEVFFNSCPRFVSESALSDVQRRRKRKRRVKRTLRIGESWQNGNVYLVLLRRKVMRSLRSLSFLRPPNAILVPGMYFLGFSR